MEVDSHFEESLLRNLKLEEPWLSPKPWESIPSESGRPVCLSSSSHDCLYDLSSVSEASLVRLVMNALQGVQSAVISIDQLSALFCADPADRSGHRFPTIWNRSLSTCALGKILKSIGFSGTRLILLQKFVDYYAYSSFDRGQLEMEQAELEPAEDQVNKGREMEHSPRSLVNQAFAVAVRKVLEGYLCVLDKLNASVHLRRSANVSRGQGSLTSVGHSEITLLEIYMHTKELRTQIEGLGHLCHLNDAALCFSVVPFEDLTAKAVMAFRNFPSGADLLSYLYRQLQVVDPAHCTLLKFLFLRSLEPYCGFIRSWIYKSKINDPYGEFLVEHEADPSSNSCDKAGIHVDFPCTTVREQDGVAVPCFLKDVSVPLLRAGQQLQVVIKLLRLCSYIHAGEYTFEDILPGSIDFPSGKVSCSPLSFNKGVIEAAVLSRKNFYSKMHEKLEKVIDTLDIKYHRVVLHDAKSASARCNGGTVDVQSSTLADRSISSSSVDKRDLNQALKAMDSDASSMAEDCSYTLDDMESSECSSSDGSLEQADSAESSELHDRFMCSKQTYLSALCFSSLSSDNAVVESSPTEQQCSVQNDLLDSGPGQTIIRKYDSSYRDPVELPRSWISEIHHAGQVPDLGWPVGGLLGNPLKTGRSDRDDTDLQNNADDQDTSTGGILERSISCSRDQCTPSVLIHETSDLNKYPSTNSYLIQSWNAKYPWNMLSMNPMLTKNAFLYYAMEPGDRTSESSQTFPCFDFSSATDPLKAYHGRLSADQSHHARPGLASFTDPGASAVCNLDNCGRTPNTGDGVALPKDHLDHAGAANLNSNSIDAPLKNACGGNSWESLLQGSLWTGNTTVNEYEHGSKAIFEIPLDFIIDKCLLQEILLQYIYISRLSIKLLEGGFDLQQHFLALRRYHFMEVADWADLLITSLWHHKWGFTEADQKIPEIQGLLESSIQRSSCERDHNKDRLYVYVKNQDKTPFSTAAVGLHSFDFIGLGYRVEWPVNIVLTPSALTIYAKIFTFLTQVKFAVLSLTDLWRSLKNLGHLVSTCSDQRQLGRSNFNYLVKLRHQVNHFVSTLQQYVLSQLADVLWCSFCNSLKNEVRDMMDLESVHMAYLMDSLHICFLADETRSISNNIESILQCALDFRSCLVKGIGNVRSDNQDQVDRISDIDISQALSLKQKFDKNLKELHLSYLKSPKHGKFDLARFWSYLNYNEYYSDSFSNEICHFNLSLQ